MKVKLELEIKSNTFNRYKIREILVDKLYNLCHDWVTNKDIPKLTFTVDEEDKIKKEDLN
tara:strand:+ start:181 stop:360 length:180 start_codon:yes stop_codon:yes gene_type:complete